MFTGIIETVGTVGAVAPEGELVRLEIDVPGEASSVAVGQSVAINGACLTVTRAAGPRLSFDAINETILRTSLEALRPGDRVNVERAMAAGERLDGHIVQGHVDGTGAVRKLEREGDDVRMYVECPASIAECLVEKGSVAIDGVSLTVVGVADDGFDVALIPHTLRETTLGDRKPGDPVNLEVDVLGKYVKTYVERILARPDDRSPH